MAILKEELSKKNIDHVEKRFRSEDGISGITTNHFVRFKSALIHLYVYVHPSLSILKNVYLYIFFILPVQNNLLLCNNINILKAFKVTLLSGYNDCLPIKSALWGKHM